MRKLLAGVLLAFGLVTGGASVAEGQFRFGANLSWGDDTDLGIGARASFGLGDLVRDQPIEGLVTFDYFFPDDAPGVDVSYWEVTANGVYRFVQRTSTVLPYVGGGLVLGRSSVDVTGLGDASDTELGLNLLAGIRFGAIGAVIPFAEARFGIKDGSQLILSGGVFFGQP